MATATKKEPEIKAIRILQSCRADGKHRPEGHAYIVDEDISYPDARELVKIGRAERCEPDDARRINKRAAARDAAISEARQKVEASKKDLFARQAAMRSASGDDAVKAARIDVDAAIDALETAEGELNDALNLAT